MDIKEKNNKENEEVESMDEGELNSPLSNNISLEKADRSLAELKMWFEDGDLIIDPEWQRNYVWNNTQASKLIESFLLNIPVPVVYFAKTIDEQYEVIDGLQRLTSIFNFLDNKYPLTSLDLLTDLKNKKFKDLEKSLQSKLKKSTLRSFELSSDTDSDIHFVVFERLNTGGTKLNDMEIRNCLFRGNLNNLIKSLAKDKNFTACINQKTLSRRMHDRALVLRFLAFYEKTHKKCKSGLKKFLNDFLETYQNAPEAKLNEYRKAFEESMKACLTVFGNNGFRLKNDTSSGKKSAGEWTSRPNAPIFQVISTSFTDYDLSQITKNADAIYEEYIDMISTDEKWVDRTRRATGEHSRFSYVFEEWQKRLSKVLKDSEPNDGKRLFSKQLKEELFKQNGTCSICNQEIKLLDDAVMDHEIHYWRGGKTIPENARLAHRFCNLKRGGS
jgi:uncharacterized protein with ParB-like and HNH nuclease domain